MSRNTVSSVDRRGMTAFSVFAALCLAGILTLFSQTSHRTEAQLHGERTSLNPTDEDSLDKLLDRTLDGSARPAATSADEDEDEESEEKRGKILRLR